MNYEKARQALSDGHKVTEKSFEQKQYLTIIKGKVVKVTEEGEEEYTIENTSNLRFEIYKEAVVEKTNTPNIKPTYVNKKLPKK